MSAAGSVSVDELVRALGRKSATLPAEIAAFIAFSGCESMLEQGPRELSGATQVRVNENGAVVLHGPACEETPAARSLHRVLVIMLDAAGRNLPPALQRLRDRPEHEINSLRSLLDQLEATLVPLNRTASRRVLARFAREAAYPLIDPGAVDAALNSLLSEPANDGRRARSLEPDARPLQVDLLEGLDLDGDEHYLETKVTVPSRMSELEEGGSRVSVRPSMAPGGAHAASKSIRSQASGLEELGSPGSSRKLFIGFALVAAAVLVVIVATSIRDESSRQELLSAEAAAATAELAKPIVSTHVGDLAVHVSEPNAQVLRYIGRAPVNVENLPVGIAHEFVASAEGHVPTRALVPANADWEATAEGARYELAMQLNEGNDALELGPSRLTAQGNARGTGSVRVVTTPRGARVYQLIGFSPDVKVENLQLDAQQELLIFREGFAPVLRVLQASDFTQQGDKRVAQVTVELSKKKRQ